VRDLPSFEGDERRFRAWVFTIAQHRLIDQRRHMGRRPVVPVSEVELVRRGAVGDLEREALERVHADDIRVALGRLSDDQQSVLMLRVFGDLTVEEVARVLGKRPGAVKALQRRALAALRRSISTLLGVPL
jgi:RNA polymerase sigma-70 factor (ECF subfamily)